MKKSFDWIAAMRKIRRQMIFSPADHLLCNFRLDCASTLQFQSEPDRFLQIALENRTWTWIAL
jgi:hypothetical protein